MEDISRVQKKPASADDSDKKVVDLTPEMEIEPEKGGKIYNLTQTEDGTVYSAPETKPPREEPQTQESDPQPSAQLESAPPPISEIDKEIDAAFENIEPYRPIDLSDGLDERPPIPDELEDLKQMADDVLSETSPTSEKTGAEGDEPTGGMAMDTPPSEAASASDPQPEMDQPEVADAADEPVDLKDMVSPQDTLEPLPEDPHEPANLKQNETEPGDEAIIDLVDIVPVQQGDEVSLKTESPPAETDAEEDEIIELVDIVSLKAQTTGMEGPASAVTDEDKGDLIELTDIIKPTPEVADHETGRRQLADSDPNLEDLESDQPASLGPEVFPDDDHVIQLSDILQNSRKKDVSETSPGLDDSGEDNLDEMQELSAGIGMALEDKPAALSNEAIEAAIERYIRARYGGDLERMIAAVVEKAVAREIEQLKRSYMDENEEPD